MPTDFAALAQAVAGQPDVEACLVLSRDGLVLAAWPPEGEGRAREVWARLAGLGEAERGFVAVRDAVWAFCRRGPYGAVAVASPGARPGLILDHLERLLLGAEEARAREAGRPGTEREAPGSRPERRLRTALHREAWEPDRGAREEVSSAWARLRAGWRESGPAEVEALGGAAEEAGSGPSAAEAVAAAASSGAEDEEPEGSSVEEDVWVDRVELSREFRGLLAGDRGEEEEDEP